MGFKLSIVIIGAFIIDGLVFPAFFGFRNSFLSLLALLLPVLYLGTKKRPVLYGLLFSVILEPFRGLSFGTLAIPFLLTVVVIYLVQMFLDIKHTYDTRFSLGKSVLLVLISTVLVYVFSIFYAWGDVSFYSFDPVIVLTIALEALILTLILSFIFNKKDYFSD